MLKEIKIHVFRVKSFYCFEEIRFKRSVTLMSHCIISKLFETIVVFIIAQSNATILAHCLRDTKAFRKFAVYSLFCPNKPVSCLNTTGTCCVGLLCRSFSIIRRFFISDGTLSLHEVVATSSRKSTEIECFACKPLTLWIFFVKKPCVCHSQVQ